MSTPTSLPPVSPLSLPPNSRPGARRRRGLRAGIATVAAGGLLVGVVGWSVPTTVTAASDQVAGAGAQGWTPGWSDSTGSGSAGSGSSGWGSAGWGDQGYGSSNSGQTATVNSDPATAAEGSGVALIDTVLSGGEAAGTGIVLTSDGEVLTNYHVVEGSTSIRVTIASTGTSYTATVVGADPSADVALLQLKDASGLTAATIDDDTLQLGDDVTAVGNAGGTGTLTAADGAVTSLSATVTTAAEGSVASETLQKMIQTDADVVSGDSGGPLLDAEGEVVGIDTAASTGQEIDGYAIPIATALKVVAQIRVGEETTTVRIGAAAFLGVQLAAGYATGSGATVAGVVAGGAAEAAGLGAGDTVTRIGTTTVSGADDLTGALAKLQPGDRVTVHWITAGGTAKSATVTLGSSPVN